MNLAHLLSRQAQVNPERPVIFEGDSPVATHSQWAESASRIGRRLREAGLVPGDRVVLFMRNHPHYLPLLFGAWWAGLVVVPVNAKLHPSEVRWIVGNSEARWCFASQDVLPNPDVLLQPDAQGTVSTLDCVMDVEGEAFQRWISEGEGLPGIEARQPDDTAWLFYTSGTTGRPKGVMITHRNLMVMGLTYFIDVDSIAEGDAIAYAAPMSHGAGLYAIPHLMAGARHVVPASGGFDAAELFALGRVVGPLSLFAAPTIVKRIVDQAEHEGLEPDDCAKSFKTIVYGGAPMYAADIQRALRVMGPRFVQIYGQGETPMTATALSRHHLADTAHPRHAERVASVGVAQTPVQVAVVDGEGRPVAPGDIGEVVVKGDSVMAGYWRNPEATANAIRNGWLWTGDMGTMDEHGFVTLKDRSKDLIISGGSNIYPREVEEVLLNAPGVAEVAVVGAPDPEWGEVVVAFVVLVSPGAADPAGLDAYCLENIARFKRPKRYEVVEALPKNNYGKVLKTALRERLTNATVSS